MNRCLSDPTSSGANGRLRYRRRVKIRGSFSRGDPQHNKALQSDLKDMGSVNLQMLLASVIRSDKVSTNCRSNVGPLAHCPRPS